MVKVSDVPEEQLVPGVYSDTEPVVGLVTKVAFASGEQVAACKVIKVDYLGGPPPPISGAGFFKGVRVFTLQIEPVTTEGERISHGDRVNIEITDGGAITVIENVEVRAVLVFHDFTRWETISVVSVAVDPEQEQLLSKALSNGAMVKLSRAAC